MNFSYTVLPAVQYEEYSRFALGDLAMERVWPMSTRNVLTFMRSCGVDVFVQELDRGIADMGLDLRKVGRNRVWYVEDVQAALDYFIAKPFERGDYPGWLVNYKLAAFGVDAREWMNKRMEYMIKYAFYPIGSPEEWSRIPPEAVLVIDGEGMFNFSKKVSDRNASSKTLRVVSTKINR